MSHVERVERRSGRFAKHPRVRLALTTPSVVASISWLVLLVVLAIIVAPIVADAANRQSLADRFLEPFSVDDGVAGILGADALGRPMLLQLVVGARTSLIIAVCSVTISAVLGTVIGIVSGYVGGWLDAVLMRIADVLHTVPSLLLALVVLYVLEPSLANLILVLSVTRIPVYLRTARAQTLEVRERTFVESSRALGASAVRIMATDVTPMVVPTIRTLAMLEAATVILSAASLSFLGVGLQRPDVDWGIMVADGRAYLTHAWWVTVFPGLAVVFTALSANVLSNWLRAVEDPLQVTGLAVRGSRRKARR